MTDKHIPSPEELRKLLRYEPETGKLFWLPRSDSLFRSKADARKWKGRVCGAEAFTAENDQGYRQGAVCGHLYRAHRVAWAISTGIWPKNQIDHINGNKSDNRLINLREATHSENARNKSKPSTNKSGYKGVSWRPDRRLWRAMIRISGVQTHLGYFERAEDAYAAYRLAANQHYGEFAKP